MNNETWLSHEEVIFNQKYLAEMERRLFRENFYGIPFDAPLFNEDGSEPITNEIFTKKQNFE